MHEHQSSLDHLFHSLSRVIFIVPVAIIAVALVIRSNTKSQATVPSYPTPTYESPVNAAYQQTLNSAASSSSKVALDLDTSQVCSYSSEDTQAQISIKTKKILAQITKSTGTQTILLNGDCIYAWTPGAKQGQKSCGVGQMVSMADSLGKFGLLDLNTIISTLTQMNNTISITPPAQLDTAKLCVKKDLSDSVFAIPQGINFTQTSVGKMDFSQ